MPDGMFDIQQFLEGLVLDATAADLGRLQLKGFIGWLVWAFVHIFNLIGFKNRIVVFVQWGWAYFTFQRSVRLILNEAPEATKANVARRA